MNAGLRVGWMAGLLGLTACGEAAVDADTESLAQTTVADEADEIDAQLTATADCSGLLARLQADAIAKVSATAESLREHGVATGGEKSDPDFESSGGARPVVPAPATPGSVGRAAADSAASNPTGASDTNAQVAGIGEADFVKVANDGRAIYVLHGSTLRKLKSWPPAESALEGHGVLIEGSPSEMFVTDAGKAVIFSSVNGYATSARTRGTPTLKVTIVDVAPATPKVARELYYEGSYVSARRYASEGSDLVRLVVSSRLKYDGAFAPSLQRNDPWGRPYTKEALATQIAEWEARTSAAIRNTQLSDWLPNHFEVRGGKLAIAETGCGAYYAPAPGVADFALTQLFGLDVADVAAPVSSLTVVGGSQAVYSNAKQLVVAQPDGTAAYRYGVPRTARSALHVFDLSGRETRYAGSGWVKGALPNRNAQFGLDVAADGTIRVATTGPVRLDTQQNGRLVTRVRYDSQVLTARVQNGKLVPLGTLALGAPDQNNSAESARFVGDRVYVMVAASNAFGRTDTSPLAVVGLTDPARPSLLGNVAIPGFSDYMHPLDDRHLITVGRSPTGGMQLQLFDVTDPKQIPAPKLLTFDDRTRSAASADHKAFTFYDGVLAIPVSGRAYEGQRMRYDATLQLVKVDTAAGFTRLGEVDHARLFADNGVGVLCGYCDEGGCFDFSCPYEAEVRRGHFVKGGDKTYVYSFSNAGVLVSDLTVPGAPIARIGFPAPIASRGPWHDVAEAGVPPISSGTSAPSRPTTPPRPPVLTEDEGVVDLAEQPAVDAE